MLYKAKVPARYASVFMAATAYAKATDGVVYNPQDDEVLTADETRQVGGDFATLAAREK